MHTARSPWPGRLVGRHRSGQFRLLAFRAARVALSHVHLAPCVHPAHAAKQTKPACQPFDRDNHDCCCCRADRCRLHPWPEYTKALGAPLALANRTTVPGANKAVRYTRRFASGTTVAVQFTAPAPPPPRPKPSPAPPPTPGPAPPLRCGAVPLGRNNTCLHNPSGRLKEWGGVHAAKDCCALCAAAVSSLPRARAQPFHRRGC